MAVYYICYGWNPLSHLSEKSQPQSDEQSFLVIVQPLVLKQSLHCIFYFLWKTRNCKLFFVMIKNLSGWNFFSFFSQNLLWHSIEDISLRLSPEYLISTEFLPAILCHLADVCQLVKISPGLLITSPHNLRGYVEHQNTDYWLIKPRTILISKCFIPLIPQPTHPPTIGKYYYYFIWLQGLLVGDREHKDNFM